MRLVLYTGKGGVGKTTTAAATAACAAERGRRTLVASADAAHSLGDVLELRLGPQPRRIAPGLDAVEIDARTEMSRHWGRIRDFLVEMFTHFGLEAVVAEELALLPGAEELSTLLAVEAVAASDAYDLVVVDCAPTDATLRLVTLPEVTGRALRVLLPLAGAVSGVGAPLARRVVAAPVPGADVFRDADALVHGRLRRLRRRLVHPDTSVRLVVTPERMVIDEARRAYTDLALFGVPCDAVVMNRLLPDKVGGEPFFADWHRIQQERHRQVEEQFAPLAVLSALLQDDEVTGLSRLTEHGRALHAGCEPEARLARAPRPRFGRDARGYLAVLPLPAADRDCLEVVKIDDELCVTSGVRRCALKLPRRLAPLRIETATFETGVLRVRFADAGTETS